MGLSKEAVSLALRSADEENRKERQPHFSYEA